MKCNNDIWSNRLKPLWFENIKKIIMKKKKKLIANIDRQVRDVLLSLVKKVMLYIDFIVF